jgi:hypothetical protein
MSVLRNVSCLLLLALSFLNTAECKESTDKLPGSGIGLRETFAKAVFGQSPEAKHMYNSTLFNSDFIDNGKSVFQCRPQFATVSLPIIIEHKFYFFNAIAHPDDNIDPNDGYVSILLTFAAEPKTAWNRLVIVLGSNTSSELNYIHSQDRYTASPRAIVRNRRDQFLGATIFDAFISLPKAGLRFRSMGNEVRQLPANDYSIEIYFERHEKPKNLKNTKRIRQIVDCVRMEKAFTIQLVPLDIPFPATVYSFETTTIMVPNLEKYLVGNVTIVGRATLIGEFQGTSVIAPVCNAMQVFSMYPVANLTALTFLFPLCAPADWAIKVTLSDGIHTIDAKFTALSRIDEQVQLGTLSQNVSSFLNASKTAPLNEQVATMLTTVFSLQRDNVTAVIEELGKLPSVRELLTSLSGVDSTVSSLVLANLMLLVQSPGIVDTGLEMSDSSSEVSSFRNHQFDQYRGGLSVKYNSDPCNVFKSLEDIQELAELTKDIVDTAWKYRILIVEALEIPIVNVVAVYGLIHVAIQYVSRVADVVHEFKDSQHCLVECTLAQNPPWPNTEKLQCLQSQSLSDLTVVSETYSMYPSGCLAAYSPSALVRMTSLRNSILDAVINSLPRDFREFAHIDQLFESINRDLTTSSRSDQFLSSAEIVSISYQDKDVYCRSTDVSNEISCDCFFTGSRKVPLTVVYLFENEWKSRVVHAEVTSPPHAWCQTELVAHFGDAANGLDWDHAATFTGYSSRVGSFCCSPTHPTNAGSYCHDSVHVDLLAASATTDGWYQVGCFQFYNDLVHSSYYCPSRNELGFQSDADTWHRICSCEL